MSNKGIDRPPWVLRTGLLVGLGILCLALSWALISKRATTQIRNDTNRAQSPQASVAADATSEPGTSAGPFAQKVAIAAAKPDSPAECVPTTSRAWPVSSNAMDWAAGREATRAGQAEEVRSIYGALIHKLNLAPEQEDELVELLTAERMKGFWQSGGSGAEHTGDSSATNEKIRSLLGDQRYERYADYQRTLPSRIRVNQIGAGLDARGIPLTAQQKDDLVNIMVEERERAGPLPTPKGDPTTPDDLERIYSWLSQADHRVYQRASGIMSAEQIRSYGQQIETRETIRQGSLDMQRARLNAGADLHTMSWPIPD